MTATNNRKGADVANEIVVNRGGVLLPLLTVLFVGLKLTGHIAWSWWWVLSPLWLPIVVFLTLGLVLYLIALAVK